MKHIIFSDIDGTLYDFNQNFHKDTLQDIKLAVDKGIEFVIATGNGFFDKIEEVSTLTNARYAITSNGASIYDRVKNEFILKEIIPVDIAKRILEKAISLKVATNWWDEENIYVNEFQSEKIIKIIESVMLPNGGVIVSNKIERDIFKIEFYDDKEKIDEIQRYIETLGLEVARMKPNHLEITHKGVSKGSAVIKLAKLLNVDLKNTMSIGDSTNDLEMFKVTNHSYAMANGGDHVHKIAKHHTSSVEQNGLGEAIKDFIYREKII